MRTDVVRVEELTDDPDLVASDLTWQLPAPAARLEDVDVLALDLSELLSHVDDLARECRGLREALHVAVARLALAHDELRAARRTVEQLRRQLRKEPEPCT